MTAILAPIGWLYGKIVDVRNALYERGWLKSPPLGAKTISVGNITAGGTGKTPLAALVAEILADKGEKICILTRGYGRENPQQRVLVSDGRSLLADAGKGGDEPVELARRLLGKAVVIADADRVSAAEWAKERFGTSAFVLDDGFQHRRAKRDVDIVCIDATNPFGGQMLPAGTLREPLYNLKRANVVVITRANLGEDVDRLKSRIERLTPDAVVFCCETRIARITPLSEFQASPQHTQEKATDTTQDMKANDPKIMKSLAFCGIGNPDNFFSQLRQEGLWPTGTRTFPDHYFYSQSDVLAIESQAEDAGAAVLVTTAKDAVKLEGCDFRLPCYVVEIKLLLDDYEGFRAML